MRPAHYTSLLPEILQHKTSRVRLFQPQAILLDFHGTISERKWEDKVIYPYVKRALASYLRDNWQQDAVQQCLPGLRNESFEQHFRHKNEDAPVIDDLVEGEELEPHRVAQQMSDFVSWQMSSRRETKESQILERLVWQDGYKRHQIQTPIYDDVLPMVKLWRERYNCSIYMISSIDAETLKLVLENTDKGNLHQLLAGYVGSRKTGDKLISETYRRFYERHVQPKMSFNKLNKTSSKLPPTESPPLPTSTIGSSSPTSGNNSALKMVRSTSSLSESARAVLFLTDSGQEAKAASQAIGEAFECLLVNRPGNKRIRSYYLSQFQYVDKFDDIEFV